MLGCRGATTRSVVIEPAEVNGCVTGPGWAFSARTPGPLTPLGDKETKV